MTPAEPGWSALKGVVTEALDLPADAREAHLDAQCPDPARRAEATRLLRRASRPPRARSFERELEPSSSSDVR